ncbi:MAG: N-glycosylase/DNA lyase [Candidatus Omnitrophica bacterium]|nr:N-glycosylase/DNA lyase [Candidatus Omnitrophota bacterium]
MKNLSAYYRKNKKLIKNRLKDFENSYKKDDKHVFSELCFCILTPQAEAVECDKAIKELKNKGLLFNGSPKAISPYLKAARFLNKKSEFIVNARRLFKKNGCFSIKDYIDQKDIFKTREWLVENVKGIGYKEASHFLRNIGFGKDLAILDVHILKNLKNYGVINEIPKSLTKKEYLDIENKLGKFCKKINIPMDELDLLFWSKETGFIYK